MNEHLSKEEFDAVKALRIARMRTASLRSHCTDENTTLGLDDLYEWLDAVIPMVEKQS